jgi:fructuronate reductase
VLCTIRDRLRTGGEVGCLCLAVAAWMRYAAGTDEQGRRIEVADPLAERFRLVAAEAGADPTALARGFLASSATIRLASRAPSRR